MLNATHAFTGIPSFARGPIVPPQAVEADVAVLGVPYDEGTGFRPGTRFGPRALREASLRYAFFGPGPGKRGYWDLEAGRRRLSRLRLADCEDVDIVALDLEGNFQRISDAVETVVARGAMPVVLGGDHSITFPAVRGFTSHGPLSLVHIDAHLDYREEVGGVRFGHGCPIRRIAELPFIGDIVTLGIRGLRAKEEDLEAAAARGNRIVSAAAMRRDGLAAALAQVPHAERIYVTLDVDALDPGVAPGTGTPDPGGLTYTEVRDLLQGIARKGHIVGCDLVEVNPWLDPTGVTPLTGAQLIIEFLASIFDP
ncbi:MAG: agmatinase [Candidatus Methylomirabilales bacterium]